jgi:hypothetical protein
VYKYYLCVGFCIFIEAVPSLKNPLLVSKDSFIELTEDIRIDSRGTPFIADPLFGSTKPQKIVINSRTKKSIIVTKSGIWDLSTFNSKRKIIEFQGNAQLILEPGASLHAMGGIIRFTQSSQLLAQ